MQYHKMLNILQYQSYCQCSTKRLTSLIKKTKECKTTKRKRNIVSNDVVQHMLINNSILEIEKIPDKYLSKSRNIDRLYLIDSKTAGDVAYILKKHIEQTDVPVIECHPGLGGLTKHLISMKIKNLHLHEPDEHFYDILLKLKTRKLPSSNINIQIYNNDILQVPKYRLAKQELDKMLDYIEVTDWSKNYPIYQLIAYLNNQDFLRYLLHNFTSQEGILSLGRPIMYLFLTPATYKKLIAGPHQPWNLYKPLAVLFQIIFKIELLMTVNRSAFIPWNIDSSTKNQGDSEKLSKSCPPVENIMYLIKLEGKQDLYQKIGLNKERVKSLQNFVTHVIGRKKQQVIPTLEQWIPGCGPHFIAKNMNVYTLFNELTPLEIFDVFCSIHNIPGHEDFIIPSGGTIIQEETKIDTSIDLEIVEEEFLDEHELHDEDEIGH